MSRVGMVSYYWLIMFNIFFQAEDGIRDAQESRGLGDVYKRQILIQEPELILDIRVLPQELLGQL